MSIVSRVKKLEFPLDELVVIGSGILDALNLREADDIDLVVSGALFETLLKTGNYQHGEKSDERFLIKDDVEIWESWGVTNTFDSLKADAEIIDGIMFVNRRFLIDWKLHKGRAKDLRDVELLRKAS